MIGKCSGSGVLYATGLTGHGFLQAPAVGEIVRDLYLEREPFMDPAPFSADRFGLSLNPWIGQGCFGGRGC